MSKKITFVVLVVALVCCLGCQRRAAVIEIPENYVGWVHVRYLDETCSQSEEKSSFYSVIRIGEDGIGCSKTWNGEGLNAILFYYVDKQGTRVRRLESTGWGEGGEIWASSSFFERKIVNFFVGSEESFQEAEVGSLRHLREKRPDWLQR